MWSNKVKNFTDDNMTISGQTFPIKRGVISNGDLKFWQKNPRIYSIVHASEDELEQDEIQIELQSLNHVKELYRDIKHHGDLINPVVVIDKSFDVIEGNSRLAAVRMLAHKQPTVFGKMRCIVLPSTISEKIIYSYLNQEHIQGKTEWSPYEQAGVIYRLVNEGMDFETLSVELGISKKKAASVYEIYEFMVSQNEDKPNRYSYYEVYLSNRKAKQRRQVESSLDEKVVQEIRDGKFTAQDFRTMLPHVCENERQFNKFITGRSSLLGSYEELQKEGKTEDLVLRLNRIHTQLKKMEKDEFDLLSAKAQKDAEYKLNRIITTTQNLKKKVYG